MPANVEQQTIEAFHAAIADPDVFCGGGSVAAVAAAGAAATALLVLRLDLNRRSNAAVRDEIQEAVTRTEALVAEFHRLADADIAALDVLLDAQRALKGGGDAARARYLDALLDAARSPLTVGEVSLELLRLIDAELDRATRFTVSDLGAAAALLDGACRGAFLTSEVNLALLRDAPDAERAVIDQIDDHRAELLHEISRHAKSIEDRTRERIHRTKRGEA